MGYQNGTFFKVHSPAEGVLTVALNRPEIHNAFNDELIAELTDFFRRLGRDEKIRLVVLKGEGKSFCAGADLNWMKAMAGYTHEENIQDAARLNEMFRVMNGLSQPILGLVHGAALGGGSGLLSICDYVLAAEGTIFGFTESRLGLLPAVISPYVKAKIGETYARAYFVTGMRFGCTEALRMGLIHECVEKSILEERESALLSEFLAAGPVASKKAKQLAMRTLPLDQETFDFTCSAIAERRVDFEGQEGMSSLLEKRKPAWVKARPS